MEGTDFEAGTIGKPTQNAPASRLQQARNCTGFDPTRSLRTKVE
jgi:hypothetical protein